ncbi:energy transducer TonB [Phaeovibrio sulfidiphilus]|uniref:Energy transducer TonB n=1 Tax=Phaeovibrio sulfidiphilus TaxID=1220600 RepID=A0A8J7CD10_9PROT|nr:energy transducer TonB [Phaeovibrio sulfidiphilus]MBE1236514.1 energy transducer TonB [Phaeovibrio sulfidiphilus]
MSRDVPVLLADVAREDRPPLGLIVGATLAVVGVHVMLGVLLLGVRSPPPVAAAEPPVLMVDLAPAPAAPADDAAPDTPPEEDAPPEPAPPEEPPPPPPEPEPEPEPRVQPPVEPKPEPAARPRPVKPQPRAAAEPPRAAPAAPSAAAEAPARAPSPSPAVLQTWQGRVLAHLERRKRYPASARSRALQGTAHVAIVIDRSGQVLSAALRTSSGHAALDREAVELTTRASPLPAPPEEIRGSTITLVVPVQFSLR